MVVLIHLRRTRILVDDLSVSMIMDISGLGAICDNPLISGKQLEEFTKKFSSLTTAEIKASFAVTFKMVVEILNDAEPCVGCRRSVERLFYDLMNSGHPALDPLVITPDGVLSIKDEVLKSPQQLCTLLHGHSTRLNNLMEKQQRNRKSRRCVLHTLEIQRLPPIWNSWREVWDCMELPCRQELTLIETDTLDEALDTYLRKHRFCAECRNKVLLASSLLTREPEPTKEKGYVAVLYSGIKRCIADHHVHLPPITEYMTTLLGRAQPWALMGRERHAKTLEIAQEEVLTCLGICIAERLHRIHRRMKEQETVCKVLAAVAVDALSRNFRSAIEQKQGISQLELFYKQVAKEELAKQHKREKLRLKRKKKKGRRNETEEKENCCDCSNERQSDSPCICAESKPTTQNINRHKLQVLDPKNKGPPTCKCPDCLKKPKTHSISQSQSKTELAFPVKKGSQKVKKNTTETKTKLNTSQSKQSSTPCKQLSREDSSDICESCKKGEKIDESQWRYDDNCKDSMTNELVDAWITEPSETKYTMWIEMKKRFEMPERKSHSSSEQSSQDCGYSSEHNISSSSLPSTPEGSEVACNDEWCDHEGACHDKLNHSNSSISLLQERGPTLTQMLKDSYISDDDDKESYIPAEEVLEFKSRVCQLTEKRLELRQILRERFAMLCSHQKPLSILH
ncbi:PREDICTED: gametogenetin-binding protein 2-like isoform X4 [Wasmannia auropunctata]|uniref:gametogenetin-binding protein 2-like isoform X4 n=1 Tax=Wasmannia auropunctata TaxID=64793 RepID=UPI0005EFB17A|nr:PREDICTED: gametogenetin-binding protein 2-like isoform X4 [Wasmannia auropunctata]